MQAEGYEPQAKLVQVSNGHKEATRLDFDLVEAEAEAGGEDGNAAAADWMVYNDLMAQVTTLSNFCIKLGFKMSKNFHPLLIIVIIRLLLL